ncbi:MAG TPA: hypothetical protein VMV18_14565 [bacterium]|nr:hypothetical protein [bacterium]
MLDLAPLRIDRRLDPDGRRLRGILRAAHHAENLANVRRILVHALAIGGVGLCVAVARPDLLESSTRHALADAWGGVALLALCVVPAESWWTRRLHTLSDELSRKTPP